MNPPSFPKSFIACSTFQNGLVNLSVLPEAGSGLKLKNLDTFAHSASSALLSDGQVGIFLLSLL
jgi:hypothetical protein